MDPDNIDKGSRDLSNYVLLGSFLGGLVGTTVALLVLARSEDDIRGEVKELQKEFFEPVKDKFVDLIDNFSDAFRAALNEAHQKNGSLPSKERNDLDL